MKKAVTDALNNPSNKVQVIYNTKKLSSNFPVEDKTKPHHQYSNIVYHAEWPEPLLFQLHWTNQMQITETCHPAQQNRQEFAPTQTIVIKQPPPCLDGWFQDTGDRLQFELKKKDQWSSFHQRKETWPQCSKRCLHIEVIYTIDVTISQRWYYTMVWISVPSSWWCSTGLERNIEFLWNK